MKAENLYHTGLIVDDVDAAKRWYAETAGYRWTATSHGEQVVELADAERRLQMTVAYSVSEPRLELVQAVSGTIWTPTGAGVHHLGYWSDDVDADLTELIAQGAVFEARCKGPDSKALWAYCRHPMNGRVELVGTVMKPMLEKYFATEG